MSILELVPNQPLYAPHNRALLCSHNPFLMSLDLVKSKVASAKKKTEIAVVVIFATAVCMVLYLMHRGRKTPRRKLVISKVASAKELKSLLLS